MVTCSKRLSGLCEVELGCQNLMDISHRWNPGKMLFLPFTEALMGKLSMSCDHTLGVFVVDELNDVNHYFSIFLSHSCLPSKFPTQSRA